MKFKPGDKVGHTESIHKGIVDRDDGEYVYVKWDDGKTGILKYDRYVVFNAFRLYRLETSDADLK